MTRDKGRISRLDLPDGGAIDYQVRISARARSLHLRITARDGLVVTVPAGVPAGAVADLVASKAGWIARHLAELQAMPATAWPAPVEAFELPAVSESWQVVYQAAPGRAVRARRERAGRILVTGAFEEAGSCHAVLRAWLAHRAREAFDPWLTQVARETGLGFSHLSIRNQRTRWGSCSSRGGVSLNCKLLFLPSDLVRYVMIHELCHTLEPNHSSRFWSLVRGFEPRLDHLCQQMSDAGRLVPAWAEPGRR